MMLTIRVAVALACAWQASGAQAAAPLGVPSPGTSDLVAVVSGDSTIVVLSAPSAQLRGARIAARRAGQPWRTVGDVPSFPETPESLLVVLGDRAAPLQARLRAGDPTTLWLMLRNDANAATLAAALDPVVGQAIGRRVVVRSVANGEQMRLERGADKSLRVGAPVVAAPDVRPGVPNAPTLTWRDGRLVAQTRGVSGAIVGYLLDVRRDSLWRTLTDQPQAAIRGGTVTFVWPAPADGTRWEARVRAVSIAEPLGIVGPASTILARDTVPPLTPNAPVVRLDGRTVRVVWPIGTPPDVAGWHVWRASAGRTRTFQRLTSMPNATGTWIDSIPPRGTAEYALSAVDAAGNESQRSAPVPLLLPDRDPPPPLAALRVTLVGDSVARIVLRDTARVADFAAYVIERRDEANAEGIAWARVAMRRDTVVLDRGPVGRGFAPGRSVRWRAFARDSAGNEGAPIEVVAAVPDRRPPGAPRAVAARIDRESRVVVTWSGSVDGDVVAYEVRRRAMGTVRRVGPADDSLLARVTASERQFEDPAAGVVGRWRYAVIAVDSLGNRSTPAVDSVEIRDRAAPRAPTGLVAREEAGSVRLTWEPTGVDAPAGWVVEESTRDTGPWRVATPALVRSPEWRDPTPAVWYRVRAVDAAGNRSTPGRPAATVRERSVP